MPTAFSSDRLYDFVLCVWTVSSVKPAIQRNLPGVVFTINGPAIIQKVPK